MTGATEGIIYVRAEYPLAVHRLERAIEQAREYGLLGDEHPGPRLQLRYRAGGRRGRLCLRRGDRADRFARRACRAAAAAPAVSRAERACGAYPTNINNVETWYNVAPIVAKGPAWFTETGSTKSAGTKVFSLVGKVNNTGLVEMPLGTPLKTFVYDVGEGGVQRHSTSRRCRPAGLRADAFPQEMFDTPVDYETLAQLGSIMGSGGMVVMDEDNCMVDVARYFIEFTHSESCGKCVPCRVGLDKALRILNAVHPGEGRAKRT